MVTLSAQQHHPHHPQQGPPPALQLQHQRPPSSGLHQPLTQQSPRQPAPISSSRHGHQYPAPFPSPAHTSTHSLPPYGHGGPGSTAAPSQEIPYFAAHPSPYSNSSASGNYSSAGEWKPAARVGARCAGRAHPGRESPRSIPIMCEDPNLLR